ncbi:MAG: phosphate signaling complex protein PhoU [bacterium]
MSLLLTREIETIKRDILLMGSLVEESLAKAVSALMNRRPNLAEEVIRDDDKINHQEIKVEESCLKILALHQPVAVDLRFITSVMKINNDLERMGDLVVNIAGRSSRLCKKEGLIIPGDLPRMATEVQKMVRNSLDSLVGRDAVLARKICASDNLVDEYNKANYKEIRNRMAEEPEHLSGLIHLLIISRHLERIGDLSTNIAEDVIYMVEGEIVRHQADLILADQGDLSG